MAEGVNTTRRDTDHVIDSIDHVVRDWTVSKDAMRSAPSPPPSVQDQFAGLRQALDRSLGQLGAAYRASFE